MCTMKINNQILKLAIPNIISNITVPLLGMVDIAIAGHLGNEVYIGAIAVAGMIFNFIYWNFGFLRMGTTGLTAQALGARNYRETMKVFVRAFAVGIGISMLIVVLQDYILLLALSVIDGSTEVEVLATDYFYVRIWAAPAALLMYVFNGWFIGMQNTRLPMWVAIVINILNIGFSLFFAISMGMGIRGIALGTVCAQYGGLLMSIVLWNAYYGKLRRYIHIIGSLRLKDMKAFFVVNRDIFLRTLCLITVFTFFTSVSAKMGDTVLAVNTLILQLFTLFSYVMDGFAHAGEALVGRFIGSRNQRMLNSAIRYTNFWGIGFAVLFMIGYALGGDLIIGLMTDSEAVFEILPQYFYWVLLVPIAGYMAFIYDGILVGATATGIMRNAMFISTAVFFIVYYSLEGVMGNNSLWLAFIIYLFLRGVLQYVISYKILKTAAQ